MGVDIQKIEINVVNGVITVFIGSENDEGIITRQADILELFPYYFFQLKNYGTFGDLFIINYDDDLKIITIKKDIVPL